MEIENLISLAMLDSAQSTEQRQEAEQKINNFRANRPNELLCNLAIILANENAQTQLRQAAGTLFTRIITQGNIQLSDWSKLSMEEKSQIKQNLLSSLISKQMQAKRAGANAISGICAIELPQNQWPEIIQVLCANANHQDLEIKKSAVLTMGYILEQLKLTNQQRCLTSTQIQQMLTSMLINLDKNQVKNTEELQIVAAQGLLNSIQFLEKHLESQVSSFFFFFFYKKQQIRDYIVNLLIESSTHTNPQIQIPSLQVLIEFCRIQFNNLDNYLNPLFNYLSQLMLHENAEIAIPAIELWNTIATVQKEQSEAIGKNGQNGKLYIENYAKNLIPYLLLNLEKQPALDEGQLNIRETSNRCLCSIWEIMQNNDDCLQLLINFISQNINHSDQYKRQAAAISFGAMTEAGSKEKITPLLINALPSIVSLLQDQKISVQIAASQTLAKVAEYNPQVIVNQPQLLEHLKNYSIALQSQPSIARNIGWMFSYLGDYLPFIDQYSILKTQIENIITLLSQNSLRNDLKPEDYNVIDVNYMATMNWVHLSNNQSIARKYLLAFIQQFRNYLSQPKLPAWTNHMSGMLSVIHCSLLRLIGNIEQELAETIFQTIVQYFSLLNDVTTDGMYVLSSLATATRQQYLPFLENTYKYMKHALQKTNEPDNFKTALSTLGDIARAVDEEFSKYLPEMVPALVNCLNSTVFSRDVKSFVFPFIADLFLACRTSIGPYLEQILSLIHLACEACIEYQITDDIDSQDYAEQLKEKLIETYICLVHSVESEEQMRTIQSYLPKIIQFIEQTCAVNINPTVDYIRLCLTLITDIANFYQQSVVNLVKTQFTQDLINTLNKYAYINENQEAINYALNILQKL